MKALYNNLDFPEFLGVEKAYQAGKSALSNLIPVGLVLITPSPECPLSSALTPLATSESTIIDLRKHRNDQTAA